ncbi:MAG: hypothetical protein V1269_17360, partial [Deltaproteobacteria bacterium]|nr:hypothetical protein [Deltaproteobacteria bacterium]
STVSFLFQDQNRFAGWILITHPLAIPFIHQDKNRSTPKQKLPALPMGKTASRCISRLGWEARPNQNKRSHQ